MESWRKVWREGIAPLLCVEHLEALAEGLRKDDPRLLQGCTTSPPPVRSVLNWPVEGACTVGYCWAQTNGGFYGAGTSPAQVGDTEEFFARICFECDQRINEPAGCRWFLNWADETPRDEMRAALLPEIELVLKERRHGQKEENGQSGGPTAAYDPRATAGATQA